MKSPSARIPVKLGNEGLHKVTKIKINFCYPAKIVKEPDLGQYSLRRVFTI
jgi:hypothetical protein